MNKLAATFLLLASCAGGGKNTEAVTPGKELLCPSGTTNAGSTIVTMDCNTVVQYEGREVNATLDLGQWGKAGLHDAPRVLREIDQAASDAQLQFTQSCRVYNSCQMLSADFNRSLADTQAQFRKLREKLSLLQASGGNPALLREALASAYEVAVPAPKRESAALAASLVVQAKDPPDSPARVIRDGDQLRTGAKLVVGIDVNHDAHVYVFQRHQGRLDVLFPNAALQNLSNPVPAGAVVRIPPDGHVFTLNDKDVGEERLYVAVSLRPLSDLGAALGGGSGTEPAPAQVERAMTSLFDEGKPDCAGRHRGLEVKADDQCSSMTRGLEVTPSAGTGGFDSDASRRLRAAPGDDVILQTLSFRHIP